MTDRAFEIFLDVLIEYRGVFLEQVAAKINPILDFISTSERDRCINGNPPPITALQCETSELFSSLEDELGFQLVMPEI